ncbi:MAG: DUF1292 domain-containing protein [Lachnospiraceae bacterium]
MFEKLVFIGENGEEAEFFVLEQTRVNGINYLLVSDLADDEESEALIVKDISKDTDAEAIYEIVENDDELESVSKIFNELLDDIDVE